MEEAVSLKIKYKMTAIPSATPPIV